MDRAPYKCTIAVAVVVVDVVVVIIITTGKAGGNLAGNSCTNIDCDVLTLSGEMKVYLGKVANWLS